MKRFIVISMIILSWACQKDDIDTYDADKYLFFTNRSTIDSVDFSFFFYPKAEQLEIPVSVSYAGERLERNYPYALKVDEEASSVDPANYVIPENLSFKAGAFRDTVFILIKKTAALDNTTMRLVLKVVENGDFQIGPPTNRQSIIRFTAKAMKPTWWDKTMENSYLGTYSDTKYMKFIEVTGVNDLDGMSDGETRYHVLRFKYYLQEKKDSGHPVMDGAKEMSVTILG